VLFQTATKFDKIVLPHLTSAYNLARWLLRSDSDAEDAVQEACVRAYQHFAEFRGIDARPWLLAIVRNAAYTALRKNRSAHEDMSLDDLIDSPKLIGNVSAAETVALESITLQELHSSVDRLPNEFKEVVVLRDIEGFSYAEIADITNLPIGTVMSRLSRARKRLRGLVVDLFPESNGGTRP
jgi:RNA polymerase sigma factor (sigma-70 family)